MQISFYILDGPPDRIVTGFKLTDKNIGVQQKKPCDLLQWLSPGSPVKWGSTSPEGYQIQTVSSWPEYPYRPGFGS